MLELERPHKRRWKPVSLARPGKRTAGRACRVAGERGRAQQLLGLLRGRGPVAGVPGLVDGLQREPNEKRRIRGQPFQTRDQST